MAGVVDALWGEPNERAKVARLVGKLADPVSAQAVAILDAARETTAKVAGLRASDRRAYIARATQALDEFKAQQARLGRSLARRRSPSQGHARRRRPGDRPAPRRPRPVGHERPRPRRRALKRTLAVPGRRTDSSSLTWAAGAA